MKPINNSPMRRGSGPRAATSGLMAAVALSAMLGAPSYADMYRPSTNAPGGVPAQSTITSITTVGTNTTVCWYGMEGWYAIEATNISQGGPWVPVGYSAASDHAWCTTVANPDPTNSFLFRLNQNNAFAGSGACTGCHADKGDEWLNTPHAHAYSTIANMPLPDAVKQTCYPCHTVGKNQPTGFTDITNTPHLTDVGCENCHGPAAWHKYSDHDLIHPAVSIDPKICGGCHQTAHHPTYEEYETTLHAEVNGDIKYGTATPGVYYPDTIVRGGTNLYGYYVTTNTTTLALVTNRTTGIIHSLNGPQSIPGAYPGYDPGQDRQVGCGICHSAGARMSMLKDYDARLEGRTNALALPAANDAAAWTAACVSCHDPHSDENPAQLRNPLWSTNFYTMPTTADKRSVVTTNFMGVKTTNIVFYSAAFKSLYNPNVQVCGQCHNGRGARWDGRDYALQANGNVEPNPPSKANYNRPPHHSGQYNILSGIIQPDYLNGTSNVFHAHSLNPKGCAACHMHSEEFAEGPPEVPAVTGHHFEPEMAGCSVAGCHDGTTSAPADALAAMNALQLEITNKIDQLVVMMQNWATTKGAALLNPNFYGTNAYTRSGVNSWEYPTVGDLSSSIGKPGPINADQTNRIPADIRQARFDLYMVKYGNSASLGVHNPTYSRYLLNDASNKVWQASQ